MRFRNVEGCAELALKCSLLISNTLPSGQAGGRRRPSGCGGEWHPGIRHQAPMFLGRRLARVPLTSLS